MLRECFGSSWWSRRRPGSWAIGAADPSGAGSRRARTTLREPSTPSSKGTTSLKRPTLTYKGLSHKGSKLESFRQARQPGEKRHQPVHRRANHEIEERQVITDGLPCVRQQEEQRDQQNEAIAQIGRASCRERVCQYV